MNRFFAFVAAILAALLTVSSACTAAGPDWLHFTLEAQRGAADRVHASFRDATRERDHSDWSSDFRTAELVGLDLADFRATGTRPLRFAMIREAGRLDCAGHGGESYAAGNCSFTPDPGFTRLLESRGIGRPSREESFGLMAVNARRELIDAVAAARYPTPTVDNLMALSALGVDGAYISDMARAGYRPRTIDTLIEFKALAITPAWISDFVRIGYANMPGDDLVQLKALNITPQFILGFDRIGYRHLPVDTLVQLKALSITPEFVQRVAAPGAGMPPIEKLVQLKTFSER